MGAGRAAAAFPLPALAQGGDIHDTDMLLGLVAVLVGLVAGCLFESNSSAML